MSMERNLLKYIAKPTVVDRRGSLPWGGAETAFPVLNCVLVSLSFSATGFVKLFEGKSLQIFDPAQQGRPKLMSDIDHILLQDKPTN